MTFMSPPKYLGIMLSNDKFIPIKKIYKAFRKKNNSTQRNGLPSTLTVRLGA